MTETPEPPIILIYAERNTKKSRLKSKTAETLGREDLKESLVHYVISVIGTKGYFLCTAGAALAGKKAAEVSPVLLVNNFRAVEEVKEFLSGAKKLFRTKERDVFYYYGKATLEQALECQQQWTKEKALT